MPPPGLVQNEPVNELTLLRQRNEALQEELRIANENLSEARNAVKTFDDVKVRNLELRQRLGIAQNATSELDNARAKVGI